jgi:hypothetical protein
MRRFRKKSGPRLGPQQTVFRFQPRGFAQRLPQIDLRSQNRQQPGIFPGLLQKIACAAPHGFHSHFHAAPCSHHHHR